MSPRAACRLETLGFERAYDYAPGKSDWLARGLPTEGAKAKMRRVGELARDDVVTCRLDDRIAEVRSRVESSPYGFALVTTPRGTLLGRLRVSALARVDDEALAESLMEPGPSTVRPDVEASSLAERLEQRGLDNAVVTTPDGRLIGVLRRAELDVT